MSLELVSARRGEEKFNSLVSGDYDQKRLAIPIQSLKLGQGSDLVTFEIKSRKPIHANDLGKIFLSGIKMNWLLFLALPLLTVFLYTIFIGKIDMASAFAVSGALGFSYFGAFAVSDYYDLVQGKDSYKDGRLSGLLGLGHFKPTEVLWLGWGGIFIGASFGLLLLVQSESSKLEIAVVAGVLFGIYLLKKTLVKLVFVEELIGFFLFGPVLMWGLGQVMLGESQEKMILLGLAFGMLAMISIQAHHLKEMVVNAQSGYATFVGKLGFDRAKKVLMAELFLLQVLSVWVFFILASFKGLAVAALFPLAVIPIQVALAKVKSPLGYKAGRIEWMMKWLLVMYSVSSAVCLWISLH